MFQFRYEYTLADMSALDRAAGLLYRRRKVFVTRTALTALGVVYLALGAVDLSAGGVLRGIVFLTAGAVFAALALFYHQINARRSKKMTAECGEMVVELGGKGVWGRSGAGESFYPYDSVADACRCRERYFLFLDPRRAVLLPERALVRGEPGALGPFLEEKLGKAIQELR